jgi:hypothetical protein
MKIQLLIVSFITAIFPLFSKAQTNRVIFSGVYETNIFNSPSYKASFLYEHAINEKISLNYNFSLGVNGQDGFVFQGPMGAYGGSILLLWALQDEEDYYAMGILGFFIPEGLTFHIPFGENTILSPYFNILALQHSVYRVSPYFEGGFKIKQYFTDRAFLQLDFGISSAYTTATTRNFISAGIGFDML